MFFDTEEQKILLGNSVPLPEEDLDDAAVESETGIPTEESALMQYYFESIIGNIGKPDFKNNYLTVKTQIISLYDIKQQKVLADTILKKISDSFDYEPTEKFNTDSYENINDVYKFIEFLEYNHEEFIESIWKFLNPDIVKLDIDNYCKRNSNKIIKEIDEQLESKDYDWLISDFLGTNNKENLIRWFCEKSKPLITLIKIRILKGVRNG